MTGTLLEAFDAMEAGTYNFCKEGKCIGCGECCSALLPVSEKEIREIKRYVKKKHIKPVTHNALLVRVFDLTCPFLDNSKSCDKCRIYPVRPRICREFQCNQPPSKIRVNKELFWKNRAGVNMWEVDWTCK